MVSCQHDWTVSTAGLLGGDGQAGAPSFLQTQQYAVGLVYNALIVGAHDLCSKGSSHIESDFGNHVSSSEDQNVAFGGTLSDPRSFF